MPIFTLSQKTKSFVYTDINELATLPLYKKVNAYCWGWGRLKSDPAKYYKDHNGHKVFHVRMWLWLGGTGTKRRDIRADVSGVYAEGCQYLIEDDPVWFLGTIRYDHKYSTMKGFPFFIIDTDMVIPPYSADGREFCARKNAIIERQTYDMVSQYMNTGTGEVVPGQNALEEFLKGERDGGL